MGHSEVHWAAIVPAAGSGHRMMSDRPKQFMSLGKRPIVIHTLTTLASCPDIETIMVVVQAEEAEEMAELIGAFGVGKVGGVVAGGQTRQESVINGLKALNAVYDYVLIHDGVRPLVDLTTIERVMAGAREMGAATAGIPSQDSLAQVNKHHQLEGMLPRNRVWQVQTPQGFWRPLLAEAQLRAQADGFVGTDESGLVLRMDKPVRMVEGSPLNIKLTTPGDMRTAKALVEWREEG